MGCVFCDIVENKLESEKIYEDEKVLAFKDVEPQAPVHFLVIPKKHIKSLNELKEQDFETIGHIFKVIKKLVKDLKVENGFRVVNNCGDDGGQTVEHIHFHVLAKRKMSWPPGWKNNWQLNV